MSNAAGTIETFTLTSGKTITLEKYGWTIEDDNPTTAEAEEAWGIWIEANSANG